jgi:predicted RNase H-like HicB family nuclease
MVPDEIFLELTLEPLEEGGYLATSRDIPGLVAQGRTAAEALEIARDVARKLIESYLEHEDPLPRKIKAALKRSRQTATVTVPIGLASAA